RIRTGRWRWLLGAWLLVVTGFTGLLYAGLQHTTRTDDGAVMYGGLMLFVLALAALVAPALAAQSVNGDRERGVLAALQVTALGAGDIATGKLVAAWGTSVVFLALTLPDVLWCVAAGGVQLTRLLVTMGVMVLLLGVICAIALALSALLRRTTTSGLLSYLAVFALSIGTLVVFGLVSAATQETRVVHTPVDPNCSIDPGFSPGGCSGTYTESVVRTDRTWWLLAPNPFLILADSAPQTAKQKRGSSTDPLGSMARWVRDQRRGPTSSFTYGSLSSTRNPGAVWPWGLGFDVLLGAGGLWLTTRRLRTPTRKLARGARIA
ncbi:MAG: hypothetical protein QOE64_2438, partial [Frankiales bacterium]|nr:hypothetical protein [Frankiales bacterium]